MDGTFILYVNDDEIKKPIVRIEKNKEGVEAYQPTISYYRTLFERKKKLIQAFVHRYVGDDFLIASKVENDLTILEDQIEKAEEMPETIQEKVK